MQKAMTDYKCKSKYITTSEATKEAIWLKNFIGSLGVVPSMNEPL